MSRCAIGVDLGGSKIALGIVSSNGRVIDRVQIPTQFQDGAKIVVSRLSDAIRQLIARAPLPVAAVGVAAAGQIDSSSGVVLFGPNLEWREFPLGAEIQSQLALPVYVLNDVRAATYAEWCCGAGQGASNLVCFFVGTGVGGGLVIDGRLHSGYSNCAGELGHMTVNVGGRRCHCGGQGCLEALAGGRAMAEIAVEELTSAGPSVKRQWPSLNLLTAKDVCERALDGNPLAVKITDKAIAALTAGVVSMVHAINPSHIILGGGIMEGMPSWVVEIDARVRQRALKSATQNLQILAAAHGSEAGIVGAALLAYASLPAPNLNRGG